MKFNSIPSQIIGDDNLTYKKLEIILINQTQLMSNFES